MVKKNIDIRRAAKENSVFLWEIAEKLGVSEPTLNRYLRKKVTDSQKGKFRAEIEQIKLEHEAEQDNE